MPETSPVDAPHPDLAARRLQQRRSIGPAEWHITISLELEGGHPVEVGTLRFSEAWAASSPNALGNNVAAYLHEKATKRNPANGKKRAK
jgi:hypothetical protein